MGFEVVVEGAEKLNVEAEVEVEGVTRDKDGAALGVLVFVGEDG